MLLYNVQNAFSLWERSLLQRTIHTSKSCTHLCSDVEIHWKWIHNKHRKLEITRHQKWLCWSSWMLKKMVTLCRHQFGQTPSVLRSAQIEISSTFSRSLKTFEIADLVTNLSRNEENLGGKIRNIKRAMQLIKEVNKKSQKEIEKYKPKPGVINESTWFHKQC